MSYWLLDSGRGRSLPIANSQEPIAKPQMAHAPPRREINTPISRVNWKSQQPIAYRSLFTCTTFAGGKPLKYVEEAWL